MGMPDHALELKTTRTKHKDLILTDMVMPGMSGRELASRLQARRPTLQVIYMSGYSEELLRRGVDGLDGTVIEKPFTREPLLAAVAKALREKVPIPSGSR
jgi:two-component system cell cycle sensor histidine kinase/response regulator CckA